MASAVTQWLSQRFAPEEPDPASGADSPDGTVRQTIDVNATTIDSD
jgi:hypothetical protein